MKHCAWCCGGVIGVEGSCAQCGATDGPDPHPLVSGGQGHDADDVKHSAILFGVSAVALVLVVLLFAMIASCSGEASLGVAQRSAEGK